jgi:hypothetical protein
MKLTMARCAEKNGRSGALVGSESLTAFHPQKLKQAPARLVLAGPDRGPEFLALAVAASRTITHGQQA